MDKRLIFPSLISLYVLVLCSLGSAFRQEGLCSWVYHHNTSCYKSNFLCSNGECIDRKLYCNGRDDCGDYSDERYCHGYSSCQNEKSLKQCSGGSGRCIPQAWFCDGIPDCPSGEDEIYCGNNVASEVVIKERALQWLMKQKQAQPGTETWGSLVDKSAVAFYLANYTGTSGNNKTLKEMAYEVSIQLLSRLADKKLRDIPSSDLASYVNAFLVTCLDPRKFHGLDIVQELRSRVDRQNSTNPYVLLSLCIAGDTITEWDTTKLVDAFWARDRRTFWTDVQAIAVMALACASKQPANGVDVETLHELTLELKQHQYRNGTVENLQTTALVMQALLASEPDSDPENFDEKKALQQIFAMQKSDGSFGSLMDTYYVLPVLNCKSLVNISSHHCSRSSRKDEKSALEDLAIRSGPKIRVRYSLWIGNDRDLERTLILRVPANTSFYGIMEMAGEIDSRYRFEYVVKNNKPYVNALSGIKDNPEKSKFWFLYTVSGGKPSPSQESPVDVTPKENDHFVMWYQSGSWID